MFEELSLPMSCGILLLVLLLWNSSSCSTTCVVSSLCDSFMSDPLQIVLDLCEFGDSCKLPVSAQLVSENYDLMCEVTQSIVNIDI